MMARLISLLLACTTDATSLPSSLTAAKVDADVRVPNASFAKKVNTAVLQVHTPGPSFLLFGFPKCGTSTLWAWIAQHPKVKTRPSDGIPPRVHAGESVDLTKEIHSLDNSGHRGQVDYDGWQPETRFSSRLPSSPMQAPGPAPSRTVPEALTIDTSPVSMR